jgi:hypothetical protein
MSKFAGHTGTATVDGATVCITAWEANVECNRLDATSFCSDGNREFVAGLKQGTGSVTAHTAIDTWTSDESITLVLAGGGVSISGEAFLNFAGANPVDGIVEYTYDVQFTGEVTVA